jgi:hypothetical protein
MAQFFRTILKLGLLAAIGIGVALAVKKLTAPPPLPDELEPWPPLPPDPIVPSSVAESAPESSNGSTTESEASSASSN